MLSGSIRVSSEFGKHSSLNLPSQRLGERLSSPTAILLKQSCALYWLLSVSASVSGRCLFLQRMLLEAVSVWAQKTQTFTSPSHHQRNEPCLLLLTLLTDLDTPPTADLGSPNPGDTYKVLNSPGEFLHHLSLRIG